MPRRARLVLPGIPLHITQRGNNRLPCFFEEADYRYYLDLLENSAAATRCEIHAFVLMTNHIHLLITPRDPTGAAALMKTLGERYVRYVNRRHERSGTLWEGRYRSSPVDSNRYLLTCYRYIELNPVRANMVARPDDYRWSSHRANAYGIKNSLLIPHALYDALGVDAAARRQAYRLLFETNLSDEELGRVRLASCGNRALGNDEFIANIQIQLGGNATTKPHGRPSKS